MKILAAVFSAILIPLYAYIAYAVFNPKTSPEYVSYYINKTTTLTIRQQKELVQSSGNLQPIVLGKTYLHNDKEHFIFDGWSYAEKTIRWSRRKQVRILFYLDKSTLPSGPRIIKIRMFPLGKQELLLSVNHGRIIKYLLKQEQEITIVIDSSDMKNGLNELSGFIPNARKPGNRDIRTLGVAIKSLKIE